MEIYGQLFLVKGFLFFLFLILDLDMTVATLSMYFYYVLAVIVGEEYILTSQDLYPVMPEEQIAYYFVKEFDVTCRDGEPMTSCLTSFNSTPFKIHTGLSAIAFDFTFLILFLRRC